MSVVMFFQTANAVDFQTASEPTSTLQPCLNDLIYDVAFSPDGQSILTTWGQGQVRLWKTDTGELIRTFDHPNRGAITLAFSPDGSTFLTGGDDRAILWDVDTGLILHEFPRDIDESYGTSVAFTSDAKYAVTGGFDGATIWDIKSGDKLHSFSGIMDQGIGQFVQISSHGQYIITTDIDEQKIYVWDVTTSEKIHTFDKAINAIFSADSQYIVTYGYQQQLVLWDMATFQIVNSFDAQGTNLSYWQFSLDSRYFLAAINDQFIIWEVKTGNRLLQFPIPVLENAYGILSDSEHLVMPQAPSEKNQNQDHVVDVWDIKSGTVINTFAMGDKSIYTFDFSPDGQYMIIGTLHGEIELWDIQRGKMIRQFCEKITS
jgi:WD40 repeat protein